MFNKARLFATRNIIPLAITLVALLIALSGNDASYWLRYDRDRILSGEIWRIITGNFVHLEWRHLTLNLAGLLITWALIGRFLSTRQWTVFFILSSIGVSAGLLAFMPGLRWYVGLSGVLHGMLIIGIIACLRAGYRLELLLLILVVGKLGWEQIVGPMPGSSDFLVIEVVVNSHLYGAVSGAALAVFLSEPRIRRPEDSTKS